ncbi:unnamed protein product [Calicophoron daubneyi]|uniref:CWH43-like N-terminal domain-containing protein n=1 Tax=Calicophoron daubneyi TaxID=300641 RepID=A0AAV2TW87_CALDB
MHSCSLHILPLLFGVLMIATFIISYSMSVVAGNASTLFPYISETGSFAPESCVFGQLLNLSAFLAVLSIYCWYCHQLEKFESLNSPKSHVVFARVTIGVGLLAAMGLSLVGNFQISTVLFVHLIGAFMSFGFGTLYMILITHTSRVHLKAPKWLWILRCILTIVCTIVFALSFVFMGLISGSRVELSGKWTPEDKGYVFHTLNCTCEWLHSICFLLFFVSLAYELRDYTLDPVKTRYRYENVETGSSPARI